MSKITYKEGQRITVKQYADAVNITRQAAYLRIRSGKYLALVPETEVLVKKIAVIWHKSYLHSATR